MPSADGHSEATDHVIAIVVVRSDSAAISLAINGRSVLAATIQVLRVAPEVSAIAVAFDGPPPQGLAAELDDGGEPPVRTAQSDAGRWAAILAALAYAGACETVLVHDPDRPLVAPAAMGRLLRQSRSADAVMLALPVVSSIKRVVGGRVEATIPRERLHVQQGSWAFGRRPLEAALRHAVAEGWDAHDEMDLALRAGMAVQMTEGQPLNVAVTTRDDARFAEMAIERGLVAFPWQPAEPA